MNRLAVSLIALSLVGTACQSQPGKYNLTGIWKAECFHEEAGRKFVEDITFYKDNTFEQYMHLRYKGKSFSQHSGPYQSSKNKLILNYEKSDFPIESRPSLKRNTYDLNWIDSNTVEIVSSSTKCNAYRQNST